MNYKSVKRNWALSTSASLSYRAHAADGDWSMKAQLKHSRWREEGRGRKVEVAARRGGEMRKGLS